MGSSRFDVPDEQPAGYLLIGDSASIPGINGIIGVVPDDVPIEMYLEQHDDNDTLIPIAQHPRLRVHWVDPARREIAGRGDREPRLVGLVRLGDTGSHHAQARPDAAARRIRVPQIGDPRAGLLECRARDGHPPRRRADARDSVALRCSAVTTAGNCCRASRIAWRPRGSWRAQAAGRLLAPLRSALIASGVLQAVITLVQLAPFVLLVELARLLVSGAESSRLREVGFAAVALLGFGTVLGAALTLWLHVVDARFASDLRSRLLSKLSRLPLGWFTARGSGSIKQLVADDTLSLHYLVTHAIPDAVAAVVAPLAVLVYLFVVDWRVALVLFVPVLVYLVLTSSMTIQSGPRIPQSQRWAERMSGEAGAYLEGQPVIRVFGGAAASSFRRRLDEYVGFLVDWQRPLAGKKTMMDLVTRPSTFLWLIAATGTLLVVAGRMDPVNLLPFLLLGTTFGARLLNIAYGLGGIRAGLLAARRLQVTLDEPELAVRDEPRQRADDASATVVFDQVSFGYRPGVPVIQDVSLTLRPGTVTALVGPSGSGKSTLAALLARFYDVATGRDTRWRTRHPVDDRRRALHPVGFVLQETQLVHGTVAENIALAVPDATPEQIEAAAREAQIHERIMRLPRRLRHHAGRGQRPVRWGTATADDRPRDPGRHRRADPRRGHRVRRPRVGIPCAAST